MHHDWFTPKSAHAAIPTIRRPAERARDIFRALRQWPRDGIASDRAVDTCYFDALVRLHEWIGQLTRLGVRVTDLDRGRIEFPASRGGRPVLLGWEPGEAGPGTWRELDDDASRRRPIDDGDPWDEPAGRDNLAPWPTIQS